MMKQVNEIKITLKNTQVIKDFEAVLKPPRVEIVGSNAKGKSTLLNSISQFLGVPISLKVTKGEEAGGGEMILEAANGEMYVVNIERTKMGETVKLITPDNKSCKGAAATKKLTDIFGMVNLSVEKIITMTDTPEGRRKLNEILLKALPEKDQEKYWDLYAVYTNSTKKDYADNAYNTRKELNSQLTTMTKLVAANKLTAEEISILKGEDWSGSLHELETTKENALVNNAKILNAQGAVRTLSAEITDLESQLKEKKERLEAAKVKAQEEPVDVVKLTERIEGGKLHIKKYNDAKAKKAVVEENNKQIVQLRTKVEEQNTIVEDARTAAQAIIKNGDFGIPNLEITDDGFEVDGIPFIATRMAKSDMRKYSALLIKRTSHAPVLLVDDVEGMDEAKIDELEKQAIEEGYILIVSRWLPDKDLEVINKVEISG